MATTSNFKEPKPGWRRVWGFIDNTLLLSISGAALTLIGSPLAVTNLSAVLSARRSQESALAAATTTSPPTTEATTAAASFESVGVEPTIFFAVGIVLVIVGFTLTWRAQNLNRLRVERAEKRRAQSVTRFTDELGSTLDVLVDFSRTSGDKDDADALVKNVLREGRRLYAHGGVRVCLYLLETVEVASEVEGEGDDDDAVQSVEYLSLREYDGRRDSPRLEFRADDDHGRCLIEIAKKNRSVAVVDPKNPPDGITVDHSEHSEWQSYLAVPLISERTHLGVLLIDTRDRTNFTSEDRSIGWTIAKLTAHALRAAEREARNTRPEAQTASRRISSVRELIEKHGALRVSDLPTAEGVTIRSRDADVRGDRE